jgi:hypothetical protein
MKILRRLFIVVTVPVWVPTVFVLWCAGGTIYFIGWLVERPIRYVLTGDGEPKWFSEDGCPF